MRRRFHAVVNPVSSGGRTKALWPEIERRLAPLVSDLSVTVTEYSGHATALTRDALRQGAEVVIAVGGDGTLNECVNGFFGDDGALAAPGAALGLVMSGTGGDFRRTLGFDGSLDGYLKAIVEGQDRTLDVGRVSFTDHTGAPATRHFLNIASFGISGAVDRAVNKARLSKVLGGRFAFAWNSLATALTYKNQPVRIVIDDSFETVHAVYVTAVSNGRTFGGGMAIAPHADPADGLFDVVIVHDMSKVKTLTGMGAIYRGEHIHEKNVRVLRGRSVTACPEGHDELVLLDIDGEAPGRLPATFDLLPGAITVRA